MLIATMIALLFLDSGASMMLDGIDQMKDNVKHEITDENARKAALDIVDQLKDTTRDYAKADSKDEKELIKLIQDYSSTTEMLKANIDASFQKRLQYQKEMLALRYSLKDKLSREQWVKVFPKDKPAS